MVHLVPDEGVDDGPVLAQEIVPIKADDSLESLEARIHAVEHRCWSATLKTLTTEGQAMNTIEQAGHTLTWEEHSPGTTYLCPPSTVTRPRVDRGHGCCHTSAPLGRCVTLDLPGHFPAQVSG